MRQRGERRKGMGSRKAGREKERRVRSKKERESRKGRELAPSLLGDMPLTIGYIHMRCIKSSPPHVAKCHLFYFISKLEIRSVERGRPICLTARSTVNEVSQLWPDALRMLETAIFPLSVLNLTSASCSATPISLKRRKFRRFAYKGR